MTVIYSIAWSEELFDQKLSFDQWLGEMINHRIILIRDLIIWTETGSFER